MTLHPLITHELSLARLDHLRREAAAARSTKVANGDLPADIRWIRRFARLDETRCAAEQTSW